MAQKKFFNHEPLLLRYFLPSRQREEKGIPEDRAEVQRNINNEKMSFSA
jgi:hypothetical protein